MMYDLIKKWYWYDWIVFAARSIWLLSVLIGLWEFHDTLSFPLWLLFGLPFIVFSFPFLIQQFFRKFFVLAEIVFSGCYCILLAFYLHDALWQFIPIAFVIGFYSKQRTYIWSGSLTIVLIPFFIGIVTAQPLADTVLRLMSNHGVAFGLGYAFQLLVTNHKQGLIMREQNKVLEQYVHQVEQLTLLEERNRVSRELHDTVGHAFTAMIMGMESIRSSLADEKVERKLNALLNSARDGLKEMRKLVHHLEPSAMDLSLIQYARQLIDGFMESTDTVVKFRCFGEEYHLPKEVKLTIIRCMQEALTNAVRHGRASEIRVYLYFDSLELRLQVEDNGGKERGKNIELGFGLRAMKERLQALQGNLSIHTDSMEETVMICTIPRNAEDHHTETIKVILVDDQRIILDSLRTALESQSRLQIVGMAESGEEALTVCSQTRPDIVLMDVNMPNMNGIEAMEVIKERDATIKVVILSAIENVNQAVEALQKGANGYLLKSVQPKELMDTLRFIHSGDTIIHHEIANQVFEQMKQQNVSYEKHDQNEYGLTPRELEIINCLAKGMRYKTIAARLFLSEGTVRNYASELYAKLDVSNRDQAIKKCLEKGLISK
ncbi:histidine kinase [Paenibacillus sp. 79R4]|uniref:helix-turn-helix transcriptional regulator n=1 Tax=Paenibacillus sp. 79R4 TaxID=2212847 RepID=UPI0015BA240D|nr:hybrid sensor histidine kinase/response regulator transcription factor [Paenibacillus sp. 79R4]NWL87865.1 histidine kinase [Paenibacillus sp. 79R4]